MSPVARVGVVVPVRDEEALLGRCLDALAASAWALRAARPDATVKVVVVLDGCRDASAQVADASARRTGLAVDVLTTPPRGVGAARALGAEHALRNPGEAWLATTDADSLVPRRWLLAQVQAADAGWDARVGTVVLDRAGDRAGEWAGEIASGTVNRRWSSRQCTREGHPHVHGANLGVRASAYRLAGSVPHLSTGEDAALVRALERCGARILRTAVDPVTTSARYRGRAPGGVAADLLALACEPPLAPRAAAG